MAEGRWRLGASVLAMRPPITIGPVVVPCSDWSLRPNTNRDNRHLALSCACLRSLAVGQQERRTANDDDIDG
jgi:hypothetical protein